MVTAWITSVATVIVSNMWLLRSWWLVREAHLTQLKMRQHVEDSEQHSRLPRTVLMGDVLFKVRSACHACSIPYCP
jgi:hypothetical protein